MQPISFSDAQGEPLATDHAVLARVSALLAPALRRQLWYLLLDAAARQLPELLVFELPEGASPPDALDQERIGARLCDAAQTAGASVAVPVLERPGARRLAGSDREWLLLAVSASRRHDLGWRGPLLLHDGGVRWVGMDDLG